MSDSVVKNLSLEFEKLNDVLGTVQGALEFALESGDVGMVRRIKGELERRVEQIQRMSGDDVV